MVGKVVKVIVPVEIVQDEETSEAETSPPKWPRDPGIEITVVPGRWIIANDGRSVIAIVFFNLGGPCIFGNLRRRSAGAGLIFGT
jgi:hypothetical protein